mgnify:CR=1 FL=1
MPNDRIAVRATYVHSRETTPEIVPLYAPVVAEKALSMLVHILVLTTQPNTSRCARFNAAKRKMKQPVNRAILSSFRLVFAIAISSCKLYRTADFATMAKASICIRAGDAIPSRTAT